MRRHAAAPGGPCPWARGDVGGDLGPRRPRAGGTRERRGLLRGGRGVELRVLVGGFRDGFLPYLGPPVKDFFEALKGEGEPDVIFTHQRHDLHQDHRLASYLTLNTFRNHLVLEYEIPKYDGDLG